jgi:DNA-binding NarL/FixJ family response regulator
MAAAFNPSFRIYVVEDSAVLRRLLLEFLGCMDGATVVGQSGNAEAAILDITQCAPDAVIVDLLLQSGTGFDVLEALTRKRKGAPLAIVLTNFTMAEYRERAAELGAAYFFDKGKEIVKMLRVIHGLVQEHQRAVSVRRSHG